MSDVGTKVARRSNVMSRIRGRGNRATELALIAVMGRHGMIGWRRRQARVFGRPDFVFRRERVAVFVDGCFWYACPRHSNLPANNRAFWEAKLAGNIARDRLVTRELRRRGWRVLRIWEHELTKRNERRLVARLRRYGLLLADALGS